MADKPRPEVNLEISSGFFRIATEEVIYNLSIIPDQAGLPVVEKIVEVEKQVEGAAPRGGSDPYFRQVSMATLSRLGDLGRGLAPLEEALGGGQEEGVDPQKIREARHILSDLKDAVAKAGSGTPPELGDDIAELVGKLQQIKALAESPASSSSDAAAVEEEQSESSVSSSASRYLFDLDVVFQTLYELCTNETVKTHITSARENRDTYFDSALFLDKINEKVVNLEADNDNFLNVPISDVLAALLAACTEKPIQNLLKKMNSNKKTIFLDSVLPLEVPPAAEEDTGAGDDVQESVPAEATAAQGSSEDAERLEQTQALLDEVLQLVDAVAGKVAGENSTEDASDNTAAASEELAGLIDRLEKALESALPEEMAAEPADNAGFAAYRQRLLEAVLTLEGEIRLKQEDETLDADEAGQRAAAEAAEKAATIGSQEDLEQLLGELGL